MMRVKCIRLVDQRGNELTSSSWLRLEKTYTVLGLSFDAAPRIKVRIISENRKTPILSNLDDFEIVSSRIPPGWVFAPGVRGGYGLSPAAFSEAGFWERYFDQEKAALQIFDAEMKNIDAFEEHNV